MVFVIVGNPKGIVSCHHEKLLLIDPEIPKRCVAFTGGFDIARGRFDQPLHQPPQSYLHLTSLFKTQTSDGKPQRYGDSTIQPLLRQIRFLWHDVQVMIQGPATRQLHLHFAQRWMHAFTRDTLLTKYLELPTFTNEGTVSKNYYFN